LTVDSEDAALAVCDGCARVRLVRLGSVV